MVPRIGWLGFHEEGLDALRATLDAGIQVEAVITLTPKAAAKRSGLGDYTAFCEAAGLPLHTVRDINAPESVALLRDLALDILVVLGWSQIVRRDAMQCVAGGLIGAHASVLPHNRGSAPVNWAIIRGESTGGNTLMWLAEGVDSGDIIATREFPITVYDTCASVYRKVARANAEMVPEALRAILRGDRPGYPQPATDEPLLARRRPADGLIDWGQSARRVYDFIRALTRPYPGAFSFVAGRRWTLWQAALVGGATIDSGSPGSWLGKTVSPVPDACGITVACGDGVLVVLEMQDDAGHCLRGPALADFFENGMSFDDTE